MIEHARFHGDDLTLAAHVSDPHVVKSVLHPIHVVDAFCQLLALKLVVYCTAVNLEGDHKACRSDKLELVAICLKFLLN